MATNKVEIQELLNVLEVIRAEKYPDIPADLIAQIAQAQFENQDNRAQSQHETRRLIDAFLMAATESNMEGSEGDA